MKGLSFSYNLSDKYQSQYSYTISFIMLCIHTKYTKITIRQINRASIYRGKEKSSFHIPQTSVSPSSFFFLMTMIVNKIF